MFVPILADLLSNKIDTFYGSSQTLRHFISHKFCIDSVTIISMPETEKIGNPKKAYFMLFRLFDDSQNKCKKYSFK